MITVACAVLGLVVGSFLNVVVWRVPRGESIVSPPSRCPGCGAGIRAYDNVPVLSWLLLRGRCRDCATSISVRYPVVEALTGALFALLGWRFGFDWALPAFLYLGAIGIALALIDLDVHRLPNVLTLPSYVAGIALLGVAALAGHEPWSIVRALIGMVALYALYFLLVLLYPAGMGFGDVKLAGVIGLYLGYLSWGALVVGGIRGIPARRHRRYHTHGSGQGRSQVEDPVRPLHDFGGIPRDLCRRAPSEGVHRPRIRLIGPT